MPDFNAPPLTAWQFIARIASTFFVKTVAFKNVDAKVLNCIFCACYII